jgi:hypothetical protein
VLLRSSERSFEQLEQARGGLCCRLAITIFNLYNLTVFTLESLRAPMLSHVANRKRVSLRINPCEDYEYFAKLWLDLVA